MGHNKSLDPYKQIIAALLVDVHTSHSEVFTKRSLRLTTCKVTSRIDREGPGFLTKALPRLGKALDKALSGEVLLDSAKVSFQSLPSSKLPRFLGELFQRIFSHDGRVLPVPCVKSIKTIRQICYLFYKYELPFETDQEQDVINRFVKTEEDILPYHNLFSEIADLIASNPTNFKRISPPELGGVIRRARILLARVFASFDCRDIYPSHGPGAVSTKERLWDKYTWTSVSPRITSIYPIDEYFYSSLGHVCDAYHEIQSLVLKENSAKVVLVPKDSRGPRLISCEPLDFQWIQQGLGRAIVRHVESHPLTRWNVNFTDQSPNQRGALLGSLLGSYSTLDLNEASDRVTVGLVRLLFPSPLLEALLNCRSLSTVLPSGKTLPLNKFAPMGSALCFPILALTCWALLTAGSLDAQGVLRKCKLSKDAIRRGRKAFDEPSLLVYGDDVIVQTEKSEYAIYILESFGLKVNRDKSCTKGFFRESCGMDAYRGVPVTPVRLRTVWTSRRCADVYTSYIAYANEFYKQKYFNLYDKIVEMLLGVYPEIPCKDMCLTCPSLVEVPVANRPSRWRINHHLQKKEWRVLTTKARSIHHEIDGWKMLLRFFAEANSSSSHGRTNDRPRRSGVDDFSEEKLPFTVRTYTKRKTSLLVYRWQ